MNNNPFKFGTVVDTPYFMNRKKEISYIRSILNSQNHLVILGPRRYGKTSLITKILSELERKSMVIDMQIVLSEEELAILILKKLYSFYKGRKFNELIKKFRIIPQISINAITNEINLSFDLINNDSTPILEDVFAMLDKLSSPDDKLIVVFDEFQEIFEIRKDLDKKLRSIIQYHKNINYVFLGSQESLMQLIFENKKSPFYHFCEKMNLDKIPFVEWFNYISVCFEQEVKEPQKIAESILEITECHPYYTQQLAFNVWNLRKNSIPETELITESKKDIINRHNMDFERLYHTLKRTDMKVLTLLANGKTNIMDSKSLTKINMPSSTAFSSLKRLVLKGLVVITNKGYEIDDPFFREWIKEKRQQIMVFT